MTTTSSRRDFLATLLHGAGSYAVAASLPGWIGVPGGRSASPAPGAYRFPQGVASGDPTPASVVLWTRVEASAGTNAPIPLVLEVSPHEDFRTLVVRRELVATAESDHTVRVLVTGLAADTRYCYRFRAGDDISAPLGRTRTAPAPDADRTVRLAFASCQSYEAGYYGVWRALLDADAAKPEDERLDLVVHLGDFIYEALGYGSARQVPPFPSGGARTGESWAGTYAVTLDDYRHLWKTYLTDPDLREARARWPFVMTWDDHEFSDDSWQAVATYGRTDTPQASRKVAANQAWFEYVPALLSGTVAPDGIASGAHDFRPVRVVDEPLAGADDTGLDRSPALRAAVASIAIHRTLRFGRHVELVLTDTRSHRSDHAIPESLGVRLSNAARYMLPQHVVELLDAGRTANGGNPPATIDAGRATIENVRRTSAPGTMLGPAQKAWWKSVMERSTATWKLWGSSVPMLPVRFDADAVGMGPTPTVFSTDAWDGYPAERRELLGFLADRKIPNVIVLSGDNHDTFAGTLSTLPGTTAGDGVAVEFSIAGISSPSVFETFADYVKPGDPTRPLIVHDETRFGGSDPRREALNVTLRWGIRSALALAASGKVDTARAIANPRQNPHLAYVDTSANGIGLVTLDGARCVTELWSCAAPRRPGAATPRRIARFERPTWRAGERVRLAEPTITGTPPFPFDVLAAADAAPSRGDG